MCKHERRETSEPRCFSGSVAVPPYTHENRAAHGWATYTQTCLDCGAQRLMNGNCGHVEFSPWGPSREEREREERRKAAKERQDKVEAAERLLREVGITSWEIDEDNWVIVVKGGRRTEAMWEDICAAAEHDPVYEALRFLLQSQVRKSCLRG